MVSTGGVKGVPSVTVAGFQVYVTPAVPLPVRLMVAGVHKLFPVVLATTVGAGVTVMVTVSLFSQPFTSVPVT